MKPIQLFDIKTRTLGFAFCQPPKSPYQNLSPKKSHFKISNPKKVLRSQISNPKKGFAHPRHLYTWVPPLGWKPLHRNESTYLVIDGVKFGENDAINQTWVIRHWEISQSLVELLQLIHCFIPHQGLSNKQHQIRRVKLDELKEKYILIHKCRKLSEHQRKYTCMCKHTKAKNRWKKSNNAFGSMFEACWKFKMTKKVLEVNKHLSNPGSIPAGSTRIFLLIRVCLCH